MLPLVIAMTICTWYETELDALTFSLGGAVFCIGVLLRVWATMHVRYRLRVRKKLTTTGPYTYTRNPIYIANTLLLVGICAMSEVLWLCPLVLVYSAVVYTFVVRYEEAHLAAKYGAPYLDYARRVPRWVPFRKAALRLASVDTRAFLRPSIKSELHVSLLLVLPLFKELFHSL